jgi:hypothetical protein
MANVTLEAIEQLLDSKLDEKFDAKLKPIKQTLDGHTGSLADLATDVKKVLDEKTVAAERLDYLEQWAKQASQKLGIEFKRSLGASLCVLVFSASTEQEPLYIYAPRHHQNEVSNHDPCGARQAAPALRRRPPRNHRRTRSACAHAENGR